MARQGEIIARNLVTGEIERHSAHAVVIAIRRIWQCLFLVNQCDGVQCYRSMENSQEGRVFCKSLLHTNSSDLYSKIRRLSIEVNVDGLSLYEMMEEFGCLKTWVMFKRLEMEKKKPTDLTEEERDYYLERRYPAFGNLVPRDVASRAAKERCDAGYGVNKTGEAVYLDFKSAIQRYGKEQAKLLHMPDASPEKITELGEKVVEAKYGKLVSNV